MPRVLHIVNKWKQGGVERFVEGLVSGCCADGLEQSILSICTDVPSAAECPKFGPLYEGAGMVSMLRGARRLEGFLAMNKFDAIHVHTQNSSGFLYAAIARKLGVAHRLIHSHNCSLGYGSGPVKKAAQTFFSSIYAGSETLRLACSTEAGQHLFKNAGFEVIPNGINIARFSFDSQWRREIRALLGISSDELLVGCVGSLVEVKNHSRCISIFEKLANASHGCKMIILGEGPLRAQLAGEIERLGLSGRVIMPGFTEDTWRYYNAMDVLLFPSLFEGLPITLVEAQCNGIPVVASDAITDEVALTDNFRFVSLEASDMEWACSVAEARRDFSNGAAQAVRSAGFARETTIARLEEIYRSIDL